MVSPFPKCFLLFFFSVGMFPGGAADLANYFYAKCNAELRAELEAEADQEIPSQTGKLSVPVSQLVEKNFLMPDRNIIFL